ncbi:tetratricopeptide repeat protein [Flagellimonas sp. 2504JD4-2]
MKRIFLLAILFFGFHGISQNNNPKKEVEWYDELMEKYYEGDYMTAYLGLGRFVEQYPNSELVPRAIFNQACLLRDLGKDDEAKSIFQRIMLSDYDEHEAYGGIMEQYALYKNRSAKHLAEIFLEEGNFKMAEKYIYLFDKVYPYKHFCGNELSANAIYTDVMYAKIYHGKGKTDKAIKKLLPHLFYNGLTGNQSVIDLLQEYLPLAYTNNELKALLKDSLENFKIKSDEEGFLKFLGVKIPVYTYLLYDFTNKDLADNLDLDQKSKFLKVFASHPVLSTYLEE